MSLYSRPSSPRHTWRLEQLRQITQFGASFSVFIYQHNINTYHWKHLQFLDMCWYCVDRWKLVHTHIYIYIYIINIIYIYIENINHLWKHLQSTSPGLRSATCSIIPEGPQTWQTVAAELMLSGAKVSGLGQPSLGNQRNPLQNGDVNGEII